MRMHFMGELHWESYGFVAPKWTCAARKARPYVSWICLEGEIR